MSDQELPNLLHLLTQSAPGIPVDDSRVRTWTFRPSGDLPVVARPKRMHIEIAANGIYLPACGVRK
jgi:hypothetical protein